MIRLVLLVAIAGCAPRAYRIDPAHPAHPAAPTGRLAGPPAALRAGVAENPAEPPPTLDHRH